MRAVYERRGAEMIKCLENRKKGNNTFFFFLIWLTL